MPLSPLRLEVDPLVGSPLPVDMSLVKLHCAVDGDEQDQLLETYLLAAITAFENTTHRTLFSRSHTWVLSEFPYQTEGGIVFTDNYTLGFGDFSAAPYETIWLPRGKTRSVEKVEYVHDGQTVTLTGPSSNPAGTDYQEDLRGDDGGLIAPPIDQSWPTADWDAAAPVTITFTAGWGSDELPADVLTALLWYVRTSLDDARVDPARAQANMNVFESMVSSYRLSRVYA